ncbi:MAG: hypothetical protein AAFX87_30635 [Bacteroidota bacterium]
MRTLTLLIFMLSLSIMSYSQIPRRDITSNDDIVVQTVKPDSLGHPNARGYLEYLPSNYNDHNDPLPLIVFLHGRGERGNGSSDLFKAAHLGLPNHIEDSVNTCYTVDGEEKCFIVISPQLVTTVNSWGANVVNHVIDFALEKYRIDTNRIFLSGHSLGGIGTYKYASNTDDKYQHRLAGIIPVAANGINTEELGCRVSERGINVRAYHSRADSSDVKFPQGERSFNFIKDCTDPVPTADLQFIIYETLSHNGTANQAYRPDDVHYGQNVYEWIMSHSLDNTSDTTNVAPVANAGSDLSVTLPLDSVVINGSATDSDGSVASISWTQISGAALSLSGTDTEDLTLSGLVAGTFEFAIVVTDNDGATDTDSVVVTVNPASLQAPVANAGNDIAITLPQDSIVVDGSATDVDGTVVTYTWTQTAGTPLTLSAANTEDLILTGLVEGTFEFVLQVIDNDGLTDADTVSVTINATPGTSSGVINAKVTSSKNVRYLEYLPPGYDSSSEYPVLVYFHSEAVEGDSLDMIKQEGPLYFITEQGKDFCLTIDGAEKCFVVISPQIEAGGGFFRGKVNAVYNQIMNDFNAPSEVYLTGFAEGGSAIYARLLDPENDPNRWTGAAIIGARPANVSAQNIGLLDPKILVGHSDADEVKPYGEAVDFYNTIRTNTNSADTLFVTYDSVSSRQSMELAFDPTGTQSIYQWLTGTGQAPEPQPPVVDAGEDLEVVLPLDSLVINSLASDTDGFIASYNWIQTAGAPLTLTGTTTSTLTIKDLVAGTFEFSVTVTDNDGLTASDLVQVTITAPQVIGTITEKITSSKALRYAEYLPPNYDSTASYSVLIYFHSDDVEGDSTSMVFQEGPFYYITQQNQNFCFDVDGVEQCFIVIAPHTEVGGGFFRGKVNALYNQIVNDYNTDKIYLTGFDEGGGAVYARILDPENDPNRFDGIAVIGARPTTATDAAQRIGALNPKILIGHGSNDNTRSFSEALDFYNDIRINTSSADTLFATYTGANHLQSLDAAFNPSSSTAIYDWLFSGSVTNQSSSASARTSTLTETSPIEKELAEEPGASSVVNYLFSRNAAQPIFEQIQVEAGEVIVHNQLGQRILNASSSSISAKLSSLQQGVYLYHFVDQKTGTVKQSGRLIVVE